MKELIKDKGFIVSSIIVLIGAIAISIMQNESFIPMGFLIGFPIYYSIFLFMSMGFSYIYNSGGNN